MIPTPHHLVVPLILLATLSCAQPEPPAPAHAQPTAASDIPAKVDDFLTRMSGFGYSGNILLIIDDQVALRKGYGVADRSHAAPYTPRTIFDIGSMAKTFTGVAVMKLESAGLIDLQAPIDRSLPDVPQDKRSITIHQLLSHSSGICVDFPFTDPTTPYEDVPRDEAIRRILAAPLDYPPGTDKAYSNCGYILLAAIVERAGGEPFRDYIRRAILEPAGMRDTGFWGDQRLDRSRIALGYNEYAEPLHDPIQRSPSTWCDLGGGQMVSTLDDLRAWLDQLRSGRILPPQAVERLWTPATKALSARDGDYAYGWFINRTPRGATVIQHGGDYLGCGADLEWFRDERTLMITSTNIRTDLFPTRNRTDRVVPKIIFGGDHPEPPAWVENEPLLRAAAGSYQLPTGGSLVIHERGGRFFIGARGQDAVDVLMPASPELRARRTTLTAACSKAFDALRSGDLKEFAAATGEPANLAFADAVRKEIDGLGSGAWRSTEVLGTFATGYPRGNPLDYETTLLHLVYEHSGCDYAVRWANNGIAATDVPRFTLAADTTIQANAQGELVGWNIVFSLGPTITLNKSGSRVESVVVHNHQSETAEAHRRD